MLRSQSLGLCNKIRLFLFWIVLLYSDSKLIGLQLDSYWFSYFNPQISRSLITFAKSNSNHVLSNQYLFRSNQNTMHTWFSHDLCYPFDAHCCHMGTAIKHPVQDRAKLSFVIFDIRALWRSVVSIRVPECQKLQMTGLTRSGTGCFIGIAVPIWQQRASKGYIQIWFDLPV